MNWDALWSRSPQGLEKTQNTDLNQLLRLIIFVFIMDSQAALVPLCVRSLNTVFATVRYDMI